jgi:hypothetical protein
MAAITSCVVRCALPAHPAVAGITSNEFWRVLDCDGRLEWCLFYYSGAASAAGTGVFLVCRACPHPPFRRLHCVSLSDAVTQCHINTLDVPTGRCCNWNWAALSMCCGGLHLCFTTIHPHAPRTPTRTHARTQACRTVVRCWAPETAPTPRLTTRCHASRRRWGVRASSPGSCPLWTTRAVRARR